MLDKEKPLKGPFMLAEILWLLKNEQWKIV